MKMNIFVSVLILFFGCKKTPDTIPNADQMPAPFDFILLNSSGNPILNSTSQAIKLWYFENGQQKYISDLKAKAMLSSAIYKLYTTTVFAPLYSAEKGIKEFYFQVDNGNIDTIVLDVKHVTTPIEGEYNIYQLVKFNTEIVTLDKSHKPALWLFKQK